MMKGILYQLRKRCGIMEQITFFLKFLHDYVNLNFTYNVTQLIY